MFLREKEYQISELNYMPSKEINWNSHGQIYCLGSSDNLTNIHLNYFWIQDFLQHHH